MELGNLPGIGFYACGLRRKELFAMLGETLRKLRGIYGYSASEMSRLLGISNSYLSEIEHGKKQASIELLERYAEIFDIRLSSLLRFSEEYGEASNQGAGQRFITKAMSKLIDSFSASHEA